MAACWDGAQQRVPRPKETRVTETYREQVVLQDMSKNIGERRAHETSLSSVERHQKLHDARQERLSFTRPLGRHGLL